MEHYQDGSEILLGEWNKTYVVRKAEAEYWWQELKQVWDPPSEIHRLKYVRILARFASKYGIIPFPTFQAVSEMGKHRLRRYGLHSLDIHEERTMKKWSESVSGDPNWRPGNYEDGWLERSPNHLNRTPCTIITQDFKETEAWKNELKHTAASFEVFRKVLHSDAEYKPMVHFSWLCSRLDINLPSIATEELKAMPAQEAQCGICQQPLVPYEEYEQSSMKRLPTHNNLDDLLPISQNFEDPNGIAEKIVQEAMEDTKFDLPEGVEGDMKCFAQQLFQACVRLEKLREHVPDICTNPVKTKCGHVFGECCLVPWIQANQGGTSCPYCRARLSASYQPRHLSDDDDYSGDEEDSDDGSDEEETIPRRGLFNMVRRPRRYMPLRRSLGPSEPRESTIQLTSEQRRHRHHGNYPFDSGPVDSDSIRANASTSHASPSTDASSDGDVTPVTSNASPSPNGSTTAEIMRRTARALRTALDSSQIRPSPRPMAGSQPRIPSPIPRTPGQAQDQQTCSTSTPAALTPEDLFREDETSAPVATTQEETPAVSREAPANPALRELELDLFELGLIGAETAEREAMKSMLEESDSEDDDY